MGTDRTPVNVQTNTMATHRVALNNWKLNDTNTSTTATGRTMLCSKAYVRCMHFHRVSVYRAECTKNILRERDGKWHKNKFYDINIDRPKKYIRIYSKNSTTTARTNIVWNTTQWQYTSEWTTTRNKKKIICDDFGAAKELWLCSVMFVPFSLYCV